MPTPTKYTYSISEDFPNHKVSPSGLAYEIANSSIVIALDYIATSGDDCDVWFKDVLSSADETTLDGLVAAHHGEPYVVPKTVAIQGQDPVDNSMPTAHLGARGPDIDEFTFNFCDRTTWWCESVSVEGETLTDSGDGLTFESAHTYWINVVSGKISEEFSLRDTYAPTVYDGGTPLTMRSPFSDTGGDYTINWDAGEVTFFTDRSGHTITADYHYENGSAWTLAPPSGKMYSIESGKFLVTTNDFNMTTSFHYEVLVGEYVAGQSVYDSVAQLVDTAAGNLGVLEGPIGTGSRALPSCTFQSMGITYVTTRDLYSSMGMSLRIRLGDDAPFTGTRCTMRLLGRIFDE